MKRIVLLVGTGAGAALAITASLWAIPPETKQSARLQAVLRDRRPGPTLIWVFLRDKGPAAVATTATPRALSRRARRAGSARLEVMDRAVHAAYVQEIARRGVRIRHTLRWLNAVSVEATAEQVRALEALPFVTRLDAVGQYRRGPEEPRQPVAAAKVREPADERRGHSLDYGASLAQLEQIGVPGLHDRGLHGEDTVIAVFDAGFDNLAHEAFATMRILARHDFVNGDEDVDNGLDRGQGSHGTATLSVIGGLREGQLVGPAFAAGFLLAKTEDTDSETPVEEDNWAAAAEWAEALGADVISSSLGYLDYDSPFPSYSYLQMDGQTAVITRAAELAAEHGVVVVSSAGNSGFAAHNTLGAPADGRRVLAVGAVDFFGRRASFSSVGPSIDGRTKPDVVARGVAVKAAGSSSVSAYDLASGTSFACPLAAGVAALVLQAHPSYTVDQVGTALRATASQSGAPDNLLGWGVVDALAAVRAELP